MAITDKDLKRVQEYRPKPVNREKERTAESVRLDAPIFHKKPVKGKEA